MQEIKIGRYHIFFNEEKFYQLYRNLNNSKSELLVQVVFSPGERNYYVGFPQIVQTNVLGEVKKENGILNIYIYYQNFFGDFLRPVTSAEYLRTRLLHTLIHETSHVLLFSGTWRIGAYIHNGIEKLCKTLENHCFPILSVGAAALFLAWVATGRHTIWVVIIVPFIGKRILVRIQEYITVFFAHCIERHYGGQFSEIISVTKR